MREYETSNTGKVKTTAKPLPMPSALAGAALRTAQEEAERLCHEWQAASEQGCRGPLKALRRWRDDDDDGYMWQGRATTRMKLSSGIEFRIFFSF